MTKNANALIEGVQAGQLQLPAGLNPYPMGSEDYADWERGRVTTMARQLERCINAARMVA